MEGKVTNDRLGLENSLCVVNAKSYTLAMTEDEAIRIAQDLIQRNGMPVGAGVRVVDLERHHASCEMAANQISPEWLRVRCKGIFVVWFEIPHPPNEVWCPGEVGVEVDTHTGMANFIEGAL